MRSSTFSRPLHQVVAAIVALALGVSLVAVGMAPSAQAAAQATIIDTGQGSNIRHSYNGKTEDLWAGLIKANIDGSQAVTFCIERGVNLNFGYNYFEVDFASAIADPVDRARILKILHYWGPDGLTYPEADFGPEGMKITGSGNEKAASVQAAIWHFSDDITLLSGGGTSAAEMANYNLILSKVDALPSPGDPSVSLEITEPASTTAEAGQLVGPYTISTTAATVALAPTAGVAITDAAGNAFPAGHSFGNDSQFWLKKTSSGDHSVAVTAQATATVVAGRAFVAKDSKGKELVSQKLILASSTTAQVSDTAAASWTKPIKHTAKLTKAVNGGPVPSGGFEFTLSGGELAGPTSVKVSSGTVELARDLKPGRYTLTEGEVAGWEQRALGCTNAADVVANGRSVQFDIVSDGTSSKTVICTFENTKLHDISIEKLVTTDEGEWSDAGFDPATDTFTVAYSCTKPDMPAVAGQVELKHGEIKTVSGIPHGYSCGITEEPSLPTLVDGFAWNAPGLPESVVVEGAGKKLTVTNSISDDRVDFTVTKELLNATDSGVDDDTLFTISASCTKAGSPTRTFDFVLDHAGTWTSPKLPTGYSCTIAETDLPELNDGFGWNTPSISPNPVVTGQHNSATVVNEVLDERVQFTVKKVLVNEDGSGVDDETTFDIDITCTKGDDTETFEASIAHNGEWKSPMLPKGYTCEAAEETLPELNDGFEWATPTFAPASLTTGQGNEIVVTNTVEDPRVELTVTKELANAAGSGVDADQEFTIGVECLKDGFQAYSWTIELAHGESWGSGPMPAGYECTVTETIPAELTELLNDGFSFAAPTFEPAGGTVTTADVDLDVLVKNKVNDDRVTISVAKELEGDLEDADVNAGTEYIVDITCYDNDSDDTLAFNGVKVKAGETTSGIGPVPIGWTCDAVEDTEALPTLAGGHIWLTPVITGITVVEDGDTITIGNAVEDKRSSVTVRKDVVEGSATSGIFTFDLVKVEGDTETVIAEGIEVEVGEGPVLLADELLAGTYRVVEHATSGWDLVGVECTVDGGGDTFTIGDTDGATIACAATNVELGSITVVKATAPADSDVDFPVTLTGEGYEQDAVINAVADPVVFDGLLPGTYTLTEGEVDGWDNGPITCSVEGDALDLADGLTVTPGDDVTCTVTNVERGSISVSKRVEGATVDSDDSVTAWVEDVVIALECSDEQELTLTLEPGAEPGTLVSSDVLDVAAGTTCVVTEVSDGVTAAGAVDITIDGVAIVEGTPSSPVTVDAGEELVIEVVNTYEDTEVEGEVITPTTEKPTQVGGVQLPRTGAGLTQQLSLAAGVLLLIGGLAIALGAMTPHRREA